MAKLFKKSADFLRQSVWIVPITLVFITMFVIAIGLSVEDYSTSLLGYIALPTRKANIWIPYFVALIPQVAQIGFFYMFMQNTEKRWTILVAFLCHIVDVSTDVYYKAAGQHIYVWIIALLESEILYTLGSEIMLTASFGMLVELFPDFIKQLGTFFSGLVSSIIAGATILGLKMNTGDDNNRPSVNSYTPKKHREPSFQPHFGMEDDEVS